MIYLAVRIGDFFLLDQSIYRTFLCLPRLRLVLKINVRSRELQGVERGIGYHYTGIREFSPSLGPLTPVGLIIKQPVTIGVVSNGPTDQPNLTLP